MAESASHDGDAAMQEAVTLAKRYRDEKPLQPWSMLDCHILARAVLRLTEPVSEPGWISVKDRLPPEMTHELWQLDESPAHVMFCNDLGTFVGFLYNGTWQDGDLATAMKNGCWVDDVTHWMPLPPRPAERSDGP